MRSTIVPMVTGALSDRMSFRPILAVTVDTMLNFDGQGDDNRYGDGTCKLTLIHIDDKARKGIIHPDFET